MTQPDYLQLIRERGSGALDKKMGIEIIEASPQRLVGTMPVEGNTQPIGLLHGGATVALAESVGSAASLMFINPEKQESRGIEISANHLRSKREGTVFCTAKILHQGRSIHLWEIKITDEEGKLISLCKLTNMILPRR